MTTYAYAHSVPRGALRQATPEPQPVVTARTRGRRVRRRARRGWNKQPAQSNLNTPRYVVRNPAEYTLDQPLLNPLTMDGLGALPTYAQRQAALRARAAAQPVVTVAIPTAAGGPVYVTGKKPLPGQGPVPQGVNLAQELSRHYAKLSPADKAKWDTAHEKQKQEKKERDRRRRMGFLKGAALVVGGTVGLAVGGPAIIGAASKAGGGVAKAGGWLTKGIGKGVAWGTTKAPQLWKQGQKIYGRAKKIVEQVPASIPIVETPGTVPLPPVPSDQISYSNAWPSGSVALRTGTRASEVLPGLEERAPGALDPAMGAKLGQGVLIVGGIAAVVALAAAMRRR